MEIRLQIRRDTTQNWENANPILASGELALDVTTKQLKLGDGIAPWNSLPYQSVSIETALGNAGTKTTVVDNDLYIILDSQDSRITEKDYLGERQKCNQILHRYPLPHSFWFCC